MSEQLEMSSDKLNQFGAPVEPKGQTVRESPVNDRRERANYLRTTAITRISHENRCLLAWLMKLENRMHSDSTHTTGTISMKRLAAARLEGAYGNYNPATTRADLSIR